MAKITPKDVLNTVRRERFINTHKDILECIFFFAHGSLSIYELFSFKIGKLETNRKRLALDCNS